MAEEETIFSSEIKYAGVFSFKDFYKFCYDWLSEDFGLDLSEDKYEEKISGEEKEVTIEWSGSKKVTDYFKDNVKVSFSVRRLTKVKVKVGGKEMDSNKGDIKIKIKGVLVKDYQSKFEMTAFNKFLRATYEKYIIPSTVSEFKGKLAGECDEFLSQAKAYLDLEGKK